MNKLLGYIIMSAGFICSIYVFNLDSKAIQLKGLWLVLCTVIIIAGGYFLAKYKLQKLHNRNSFRSTNRLTEIEQLKLSGDKILLTLNEMNIKTRSYQQEINIESLPSRVEILDSLYDGNRNFKTKEIQQAYIVYFKQYDNKMYKFVSQPTTDSADTLKIFIDREKGINLYIDPKNPLKYYFDLPF